MISEPLTVYLIPLWPLLFVIVWAIWNMARDSRDEKLMERSIDWPEAQGTVVTSRVVWAHVEVMYEYSISSGRFTGKYKMNLPPGPPDRYGRTATRMNEEARGDIGEFPPGANVVIRYNPQEPNQSVLYCSGQISRDKTVQRSSAPPRFFTVS